MLFASSRLGKAARSAWQGTRVLAPAVGALLLGACGRSEPEVPSLDRGRGRQELAGTVAPRELNVVLITLDTLRADRLSCYGSNRVSTPHLDRLAREGARFTNASSTVPFTLPAHSSILTGTYPPRHGVRENVGYFLGEDHPTLAEMLRDDGVETAGFVSAFVLDARWGIGRGFDHYFDDFDLGAFEDANLGSVQRPGAETVAAAQAWLEEREADPERSPQPFFLWLHLFDPHDPYTPPEPFLRQHPGRPYDAEVAYTDSLVGSFVADLETRGLLDRTLLVVTGDHGEGLGDHGEAFHGYFVYDSTIRVPLLIRVPGGAAGRTITEAVSHVDLVPTVLDLTARDVPDHLQGRSLLAPLLGEPSPPGEEPRVYAESFYPLYHYGWAPLRALRSTSFKYIQAPEAELFDLLSDAGEGHNLYDSRPEVGRAMARALRDLTEKLDAGAADPGALPDLDEQALAQLRALGYLAGRGDAASDYDPSVERADPKHKVELHRLIMRAQSRVSGGEEAEAAALLRQALEEDPELLDAHQLLGNLALHSGDVDSAAGHFQRALALDPQHKPSLFGLASSHRRADRLDQALVGYRRLLEVAGQDSKATLAIADIHVERGDLTAASQVLQRAAVPGAPAMLFNRLGEVAALSGDPQRAHRLFVQALEANDRLSQPHFNLAVLAEENGDPERASHHYLAAIERAPRHYQAQFNLARLHGALGHSERELELLEAAVASNPDFATGLFFLGKALMDRGEDLDRAETLARQGLELEANNPLGWFVLADVLNRSGRRAEAERAVAEGRRLQGAR